MIAIILSFPPKPGLAPSRLVNHTFPRSDIWAPEFRMREVKTTEVVMERIFSEGIDVAGAIAIRLDLGSGEGYDGSGRLTFGHEKRSGRSL